MMKHFPGLVTGLTAIKSTSRLKGFGTQSTRSHKGSCYIQITLN